ncbi:hypothetical protein QQ045_032512 [Rhodiola kirilowii]
MGKANFVKDNILIDDWWDRLAYIVDFTRPIYEMIRYCDTDKTCLHLVYEMWDSMIEKVKIEIYKKEGRQDIEGSPFFDVVYEILVDRWTKNNTPLHCLAHSLNPRYTFLYEEGTTTMWYVGGHGFDSMEGVGFLEFAELSFDEPDLENELLE